MLIFVLFVVSMVNILSLSFEIGLIRNVRLISLDKNLSILNINGSCVRCGCYVKEKNYLAFNCFENNESCFIFVNYSLRNQLIRTDNSTFYFVQFPFIEGFDLPTSTYQSIPQMTSESIIYRNLSSINDILVGIWNTSVGGDSLVVSQGPSNGQYPNAAEGPGSVHDYNVLTKYNSYGKANVSMSLSGSGIGTGFYVTMFIGGCIVTGIQFGTANDAIERDPITMTLEGTNLINASLLSKGSSWTLIYSGPTGISNTTAPSRSIYVDPEYFPNTVRYTSYRFLMTSQRSNATNLQYSEAHLIGYV